MQYLALIFLFLSAQTSWAENNSPSSMQPLFDNPVVDMVYPQVSGDYLVYSQRAKQTFQVIRLQLNDLHADAKVISPKIEKEVVRGGVALDSGDVVYMSNRLGQISPWLSQGNQDTAITPGTFQSILPSHLDVSSDAQTWAFDFTFEATRLSRINNQFTDGYLHSQLTGQAWRMYHSQYWAYKSDYPETKRGLKNKFRQPFIFTYTKGHDEIHMLGDGFDASLSDDAKGMVFVRENSGNFDLWQQNTDGSNLVRLTKNTFADLEPSLSPNGKHVVFVSNRDSGGDILQTSIYTLEIATGKIIRLTKGSHVTDGGPTWLGENTVIFHSNRDPNAPLTNTVDNWRLWTVKLEK